MRRGAPVPVAPVFRMPVILPKLAEGLMERFDPLPVTEPKTAPLRHAAEAFYEVGAQAAHFVDAWV